MYVVQHDKFIRFAAPSALVDTVREAARHEQKSVSQFCRDALWDRIKSQKEVTDHGKSGHGN